MNITIAKDIEDLKGIKLLQQQNLKQNLTAAEAAEEGFVTAEYSLGYLQQMHNESPSVIARDNHIIAGYALATTKEVGMQHDLLSDLFTTIDKLTYRSYPLKNSAYIVVGQLCVARDYRGTGLAQKMYDAFRRMYEDKFDYCITDVAESNPRSLKAHLKSGFRVIDVLNYGGTTWNVILWDWKNKIYNS